MLPASLRMIAQGAFAKCKSLKTVEFSEGLEVLGTDEYTDKGGMWYGVFEESSIESVDLPSTLKKIEYSAFENCKNLKHIELPDKLEYIGKRCFKGSALESIDLLSTLKIIKEAAFKECKNIKRVQLPENLEKIEKQLFMNSSIESVTIPASTIVIGADAFCGCQQLKSANFAPGSRLKIIRERSF